jgi:hypothetical protein
MGSQGAQVVFDPTCAHAEESQHKISGTGSQGAQVVFVPRAHMQRRASTGSLETQILFNPHAHVQRRVSTGSLGTQLCLTHVRTCRREQARDHWDARS